MSTYSLGMALYKWMLLTFLQGSGLQRQYYNKSKLIKLIKLIEFLCLQISTSAFEFESGGDAVTSVQTQHKSHTLHATSMYATHGAHHKSCNKYETPYKSLVYICDRCTSDSLNEHECMRDTRLTSSNKHETPYKSLVHICDRCTSDTLHTTSVYATHGAHHATNMRRLTNH
jgi:hypothetical protein